MTKALPFFLFLLFAPFFGQTVFGQCSSGINSQKRILSSSEKIIEGRVTRQTSFMNDGGKIFTRNEIEVYRVFKGDSPYTLNVITEGGIFGNLMQIVTPSAQLQVGDYGVLALRKDANGSSDFAVSSFMRINERTNAVSTSELATNREALYETIAKVVGSNIIQLKRVSIDVFENRDNTSADLLPVIDQIGPMEMTAGTKTVITIQGSGFGDSQGTGAVAFRNADDGGISFIEVAGGPHYLSWSDTEIQMYVPAASLYNAEVAGSGTIRVANAGGNTVESEQQIVIDYAKSEVVYSEVLNETMLVGMQDGGYVFRMNENMQTLLGSSQMVEKTMKQWACNSGVNFSLSQDVTEIADWGYDQVNVIGMSDSGQMPSYLLGKTITTFSGCGTATGLQWNLVEVDILLNSDIDWWILAQEPPQNKFDLQTTILHELGHAHLLQHNNNAISPMYFQLTSGSSRRTLHPISDIEGSSYI
ncbi:MAG: IPT/TIG domain-containing protein, partial [Flavobacteriales bacterium]|nr:IPT/TIG domain-containing protein [Flavobacteriales bacterium]